MLLEKSVFSWVWKESTDGNFLIPRDEETGENQKGHTGRQA